MTKLTAKRIEKIKEPGRYGDGAGLIFFVRKNDRKSWVLRYQLNGLRRDLGLGSYPAISLANARLAAIDARALVKSGIDPIARKAELLVAKPEKQVVTFRECALKWLGARTPEWTNEKHRWQVQRNFEVHVFPKIGEIDIQDITPTHVESVLRPIWLRLTETATRVRTRIERVLDAAETHGMRTGPNPARWKNCMETLFNAQPKSKRVVNHPALEYDELPEFMVRLSEQTCLSARALELTIHTTLRTSEVLGARWHEFDLVGGVWVVPAKRMKTKVMHKVPLPPKTIALLRELEKTSGGIELLFPGRKANSTLCNVAMSALLERMGMEGVTVHGFRSTFMDYMHEEQDVQKHILDMCLAHKITDDVERAYRRKDLLSKRRRAMGIWVDYASSGLEDAFSGSNKGISLNSDERYVSAESAAFGSAQ